MKIRFVTLFLFFIGSVVFAQNNWSVLKKDNFSISYPTNWVSSDQMSQPTMKFLLLSNESSQEKDNFRENINLNLEDLSGKSLTLDSYVKTSFEQIQSQLPNSKVIALEDTKIDNRNARTVIWTADFGNGMALKFKQIILISGKNGHVLTYAASTAEYDDYVEIADIILYSFKLAQ